MSWGTELWDQYDNLARHTEKGIDFAEKYTHFIKEKSQIEKEYAKNLQKLVKKCQPTKKEEEEYQFSCTQGFLAMSKEVYDMAGQHEVVAETLQTTVLKELHTLLTDLKAERKRYLQEYLDLDRKLNSHIKVLENSKKQYEKAFREAEKAQEAFKRADADIYLSRAEVEKAKSISLQKNQMCEDCKNDYAAQLQKANRAQQEHYFTLLPQTLQSLQDMDEKRICRLQDFIKSTAGAERSIVPIINTCIDGITKASDSINHTNDSRMVVERYKSGFQPPADIPFEDLSDSASIGENTSLSSTPGTNSKSDTAKASTVSGRTKKRKGIFNIFNKQQTDENKEDFSNLPPNQQKKQLNKKIDTIRQQIAKQTAERDGMVKMRDVYVKNPALGDPASLDKQLEENAQMLDRLRAEEQKFQSYLAEAENQGTPKTNRKAMQGSRSSLAVDGEIIHSASESNLPESNPGTPYTSAPGTPINQVNQSMHNDSPESGVSPNAGHTSYLEQDTSFDDGLDDIPMSDIGTCRALYPFEATNEGSMSMAQDESFYVVEQDQGDGWTRVRCDAGEGYVPTSYLEIQLYQLDIQ